LGGAVGRIEEHEREWGGCCINYIKIKIYFAQKNRANLGGKKRGEK
jgi:hypothetical protein